MYLITFKNFETGIQNTVYTNNRKEYINRLFVIQLMQENNLCEILSSGWVDLPEKEEKHNVKNQNLGP